MSGRQAELYATLDSQDAFLHKNSLEHQRLHNEASKLKQVLQAKDQVIRWVFQMMTAGGALLQHSEQDVVLAVMMQTHVCVCVCSAVCLQLSGGLPGCSGLLRSGDPQEGPGEDRSQASGFSELRGPPED